MRGHEFRRRQLMDECKDRRAYLTLTPEELCAALERGLGLGDDTAIVGLNEDWMFGGWRVGVVNPNLPVVSPGAVSPRVQLTIQNSRIELL